MSPASNLVAELAIAGVATVGEAMGRTGVLDPALRPVADGYTIAGPARTVVVSPGDNLALHVGIDRCAPGDVLVVAVSSPNADGMFGELLATALQARLVAGLVIDAGVRDSKLLRAMRFPVWARCINAQGTMKCGGGGVDLPVVCGGQVIAPGDIVVCDDDGVARVPKDSVAEVVRACTDRMAQEAVLRQKLAGGERVLDVLGTRGAAENHGLLAPADHGAGKELT